MYLRFVAPNVRQCADAQRGLFDNAASTKLVHDCATVIPNERHRWYRNSRPPSRAIHGECFRCRWRFDDSGR